MILNFKAYKINLGCKSLNHSNSFVQLMIATLFMISCTEKIPIPPDVNNPDPVEGKVEVWRSDKEGLLQLAKEPTLLPFEEISNADVGILIDPSKTYQEMVGFGAALTGSSAHVISTHLDDQQQNELLLDLFHPVDGIGISFLRLTMGASDFSLTDFTYNDLGAGQSDLSQTNFDLSKEDETLIPLLKKILAINPDISIMATPWSAPAWMKESGALHNGGRLKSSFYESYATYFVKYIQEMESREIPIHSITVQNEPLYAAPYISLEMSAEEQQIFIRDFLGPKFKANNIATEIIIYDHNWDETAYPLEVLSDPIIKDFVGGTAFHCYAGDVSAMSQVNNAHPDLGIYFTECSGGDFSPNYANNLSWNSENLLVGATRNWAKSVLFWNLALDQNDGPKNGGCQNCRGVVTINSASSEVTRNEEFVLLGHMAKFVKKGARRVETPATRAQEISQVAFQNSDESIVVVAFNHSEQSKKVEFQLQENKFNYTLDSGSLVTFVVKD